VGLAERLGLGGMYRVGHRIRAREKSRLRDFKAKTGTIPENPGRLVTLPLPLHSNKKFVNVHLLPKLSRTHSKSSNNDFAEFKQCERVILRLG
jgi:hypothetical protein